MYLFIGKFDPIRLNLEKTEAKILEILAADEDRKHINFLLTAIATSTNKYLESFITYSEYLLQYTKNKPSQTLSQIQHHIKPKNIVTTPPTPQTFRLENLQKPLRSVAWYS